MGLSQIIGAPEVQQSPEGLVLASMRNQLIVTINASNLVFADASGEKPTRGDFPNRVAEVAAYVGSQSSQFYAAVGLSFGIESNPADNVLPSRAILSRLVKEEALKEKGYGVIGASTRFWYIAHDRRYDLRIEPRGSLHDSSNYFAQMDVHIALKGEMPSAEWLSQALNDEYDDFKGVLTEVLDPRTRL